MKLLDELKKYKRTLELIRKIKYNLRILGKQEHIDKFDMVVKKSKFKRTTIPRTNKIMFYNKKIYSIEFIPSLENFRQIVIREESRNKDMLTEYIINLDNEILSEQMTFIYRFNKISRKIINNKIYKRGLLQQQQIEKEEISNLYNSTTREEYIYDNENQILFKTNSDILPNYVGINGTFNIMYYNTINTYNDFSDVFQKNSDYFILNKENFQETSNKVKKIDKK